MVCSSQSLITLYGMVKVAEAHQFGKDAMTYSTSCVRPTSTPSFVSRWMIIVLVCIITIGSRVNASLDSAERRRVAIVTGGSRGKNPTELIIPTELLI